MDSISKNNIQGKKGSLLLKKSNTHSQSKKALLSETSRNKSEELQILELVGTELKKFLLTCLKKKEKLKNIYRIWEAKK